MYLPSFLKLLLDVIKNEKSPAERCAFEKYFYFMFHAHSKTRTVLG